MLFNVLFWVHVDKSRDGMQTWVKSHILTLPSFHFRNFNSCFKWMKLLLILNMKKSLSVSSGILHGQSPTWPWRHMKDGSTLWTAGSLQIHFGYSYFRKETNYNSLDMFLELKITARDGYMKQIFEKPSKTIAVLQLFLGCPDQNMSIKVQT